MYISYICVAFIILQSMRIDQKQKFLYTPFNYILGHSIINKIKINHAEFNTHIIGFTLFFSNNQKKL